MRMTRNVLAESLVSELTILKEWVDDAIAMDKVMSIVYRIQEAESKCAQIESLITSKDRQISNLQEAVGIVAMHKSGETN